MSNPDNIKSSIIVFSAGRPPIGSWHQRFKMFYYGFRENDYDFQHIVPYYAPTFEAFKNSPEYIKYCLKPRKNKTKNIFSLFSSFWGVLKGGYFLLKSSNVAFVIVPSLNFLQGFVAFAVCRVRKIPFYAEIADENGKKFSEEKLSLYDRLAMINQSIYERLILKRADKIFVFTSYLENKYKKMFPANNNILRTIPSLIDIEKFDSLSSCNILEINQPNIDLLYSNKIKIVYAGACNRTNGLFFFLDAASQAMKEHNLEFTIFFFLVYGNTDKVKEYCKEIGLDDNVKIFKPVLPQYIPAIYSKADILILPEHGDVIANAGFPGKTAELLASGKAILSTSFSDLDLYLKNEENSMISELGDAVSYKTNLIKLLINKNLRERIGVGARKTASKYFDCKSGIKLYL